MSAILMLVSFCMAEPAAAESTQVTEKSLARALRRWVNDGFPSLSVAIADSCGIIWKGAEGYSDLSKRRPASSAEMYGIGSITKTFVAVVAIQLVEEGRLKLDQTAADILDDSALKGVPNASTATIRQLMNHTSGIPSWEDNPRWIHRARGDAYDPGRAWPDSADMDFVRGAKPLSPAGAAYHYSNTNYTLLGLIIQKITGERLASEIRKRISNPLGLHDTYLEGFEAVPASQLPHRYHFSTAQFRQSAGVSALFPEAHPGLIDVSHSTLAAEWAAGGLLTTADDLVKFALGLRDGRLLKPNSLQFMTQWRPADSGSQVGHGLFRSPWGGDSHLIGHTGGVLGFAAVMYWLEEGDAIIVILTNVGSVDAGDVPLNREGSQEFLHLALRFAKNRSTSSCKGRLP